MQNFSETFLKPVDGVITAPTGDGAEAFVDAEDIADVIGHGSRPNNDVQTVTGVPPISFADFARRTAPARARSGAR
jgi:hypothetical protein